MAKTEITKILLRRGSEEHRRQLHDYGGLDQGEPGWTSSSEQTTSEQEAAGFVSSYPAMSGVTWPDSRPAGASSDILAKSGADLWIGGSGAFGEDIYVGGQSSEFYNQMRFLSISGTDLNHDGNGGGNYLQGRLIIGDTSGYDFRAYGTTTSSSMHWDASANKLLVYGTTNFLGDTIMYKKNDTTQYIQWEDTSAQFHINTTNSIKLPVGTSAERPRWTDSSTMKLSGTATAGMAKTGMIRYNTDDATYEGYVHDDDASAGQWGSLGGSADVLTQTYVTVKKDAPAWADPKTGFALSAVQGEVGHIKFVVGNKVGDEYKATLAGKFDNARNFYVTGDVVTYSSSDQNQKENIVPIATPLEKLYKINGVEFDWNDNAPEWVGENRHDVGVIAQEIEKVIPEAVEIRDDGYKAVDYKKVVPLLIESIKELSDRVAELENKN